jgi:hypothetical protein
MTLALRLLFAPPVALPLALRSAEPLVRDFPELYVDVRYKMPHKTLSSQFKKQSIQELEPLL